ncbi:C4-dicarboxylate ABC transporter, partial [Enterococcus faecium]
ECLFANVVVFYDLAHYVRFLITEHSKHGKFVSKKIA